MPPSRTTPLTPLGPVVLTTPSGAQHSVPPAFVHAGFALAHGAWSVCDVEEDLLPLAIVTRAAETTLLRFEAETQAEAVRDGQAEMTKLGPSVIAWAFARDGLYREKGSAEAATDAISVDFWSEPLTAPATLIQLYEPFAKHHRFRLLGDPMLLVKGAFMDADKAKPYLAGIMGGVQQHGKAAPLWATWRRADA